ncbi:type VI secretion system contractile sheath protein TssC [Dyadobacter aurulentus]|uniref:type VI secretion system contractile sheath protein TssC n=1 Tax=Dyadobacter sp. UC 10 TaxID=2605428 RepID=UPI0011F30494|nr:type VI secretion system contractile sheath protein TssC [Dyadobacter sp. UC 10]KAA0989258.1 type VI secretion system contractile sheath protein TssC [Dyadobacter sp. UC 10]
MAKQQEETQPIGAETAFKEPSAAQTAPQQLSLNDSLELLKSLGGFKFIETTVEGVRDLNPQKAGAKANYLSDEDTEQERRELLQRLELWAELISESASVDQMQSKARAGQELNEALLRKNQSSILEASHDLEVAYQGLSTFMLNTEQRAIPKLTLVNASMDQVADIKDGEVLQTIDEELHSNYQVYDLSDNYSLMVIPGYMGKNTVIDSFARVASKHKVMMITDYEDFVDVKEAISSFEKNKLADASNHKANLLMACNWLVGRKAYNDLGEEEALHIPPSTALAGRMHSVLMSQPVAGATYGMLMGAEGTRFNIDRNQAGDMNRMGLIPMLSAYGKVQAFSDRTMFNGDNVGLQTYSVVRVFDWINKVLVDFLDRYAFQNWTYDTDDNLRKQISKFLNSITGSKKLIKDYTVKDIRRDPNDIKNIILDISITPHFSARSFLVSLSGMDGGDEWNTEIK